jgi:hypothetical protein
MRKVEKFYPGAVINGFNLLSVTPANHAGARKLVAECVDCKTRRFGWSTNIKSVSCSACRIAKREAFRLQGLFYIVITQASVEIAIEVPLKTPTAEDFKEGQAVYEVDRNYAITFLFFGTQSTQFTQTHGPAKPYPNMPVGASKTAAELALLPVVVPPSSPRPSEGPPDLNPRYPNWTIVPTLYLPFYLNEDIHESLEEAALTYFNERFKPLSSVRLSDFSHGGTQPWTDQHGNRVAFLYLLDEFSELLSREGPTERLE